MIHAINPLKCICKPVLALPEIANGTPNTIRPSKQVEIVCLKVRNQISLKLLEIKVTNPSIIPKKPKIIGDLIKLFLM